MFLAFRKRSGRFRKKLCRVEKDLQQSMAPLERSKMTASQKFRARKLSSKEEKRAQSNERSKMLAKQREAERIRKLPPLTKGCSRKCAVEVFSDGTVEICSFAVDAER